MRFRSEWLTLFTLTAVAGGLLSLEAGGGSDPVVAAPVAAKRAELTTAGVDYMPIGTARAVGKARSLHAKPAPDHP